MIAFDISKETMNSDRYCKILSDTVFSRLSNSSVFEQDGAPPHLLNDHLPNRWIGRGGPMPWPARSPDLSMCDFFLWSYTQNKVYAFDFRNNKQMKQRIEQELNELPISMLRRSYKNFVKRCVECVTQNGGHFEHLLIYM